MFGIKRRVPKSRKEFLEYKEKTRTQVTSRLEFYNQYYNFKYGRISIKNTKTRWGSCSKLGNLNFNYRLSLIDPLLLDYVVVHELCHLGEFNHGPNFWNLVEKTIPDWQRLRIKLRQVRM